MRWDERDDVEKVQSPDSDAKKLERSVFEARSREGLDMLDNPPLSSVSRPHMIMRDEMR